jgi:hypothetical protein
MLRNLLVMGMIFGMCPSLSALDAPAADEDARAERLKAMRQIAERFKVQSVAESESTKLPLQATPLLRFNDPAREFHDASLWAWGSAGRPACLLAIEQYGDQWWFELTSLSAGKLTAEADAVKWQPRPPGVEMLPFPDARAPAKEAPRRSAQMRELMEQLSAYQVGRTGRRYELRLMPKPLLRYSDAKEKLQDGAIFAFAYGTNPELLALIEAEGDAPESSAWRIGFARCGTAEPHVVLNEEEIFRLPYATMTKPEDPYWNFTYRFSTPEK